MILPFNGKDIEEAEQLFVLVGETGADFVVDPVEDAVD